MKTDTCRSCSASIIWTFTTKGNRMPVDAEPSSEGTFHLREEGRDVYATFLRKGSDPDLHTSHFQTCPEAKEWHGKTRRH